MKKTLFILPLLLSLSMSGCVSGGNTSNIEDDVSSNLNIVTPGVSIGNSDAEALLHLKYNYSNNDSRYYSFTPVYTPGWNWFVNNNIYCECSIVDSSGNTSDVAHVLFDMSDRNPLVYVYPDNNGEAILKFTSDVGGFTTPIVVENTDSGIDVSKSDVGIEFHCGWNDVIDSHIDAVSYSQSYLTISTSKSSDWDVHDVRVTGITYTDGNSASSSINYFLDGENAILMDTGSTLSIQIPINKYPFGSYVACDYFTVSFEATTGGDNTYYFDPVHSGSEYPFKFYIDEISDFGAGLSFYSNVCNKGHTLDGEKYKGSSFEYNFQWVTGYSYECYYEVDRRKKVGVSDIPLGTFNEPYEVNGSGLYNKTYDVNYYSFVGVDGTVHWKDVEGNWHTSADPEDFDFNYNYSFEGSSLTEDSTDLCYGEDGILYLSADVLGIQGKARDSYRRLTVLIPLAVSFTHSMSKSNAAYGSYLSTYFTYVYIYILY